MFVHMRVCVSMDESLQTSQNVKLSKQTGAVKFKVRKSNAYI